MREISAAVTAFNEHLRGEFTWIKECLTPASADPLVREVVVVNDASDDYHDLVNAIGGIPKLSLSQNLTQQFVFGNKLESVYQATSEWVLLIDSDNRMPAEYYRTLESLQPWNPETWYCASFAHPAFDYRPLYGTWQLDNIAEMACIQGFWCFVNTGNQFVHRRRFLDTFGHLRGKRFDLEQPDYFGAGDRTDEKWFLTYGAQDSFFLTKTWMLSGGSVRCVPGLEYEHRIGCGDLSNFERAPAEKNCLGPVYFLELLDAANGEQHKYQFVEYKTAIKLRYRREDGRMVTVDLRGFVNIA